MLVALLGAHAAEHSTWSENRAILWRSAYPVNMGEEVLFSMKERHYTREMMGLFSLCAFMGISTMQQ